MARIPKPPQPPKPLNLYMIVRWVGEKEIVPVYAFSEIQAVTFYVHSIEEPWREKEFYAKPLQMPAKRQTANYRKRFAKYEAKMAEYIRKYGQP